MPKILLITDVLPTRHHTAGLVLEQFFAHFPLNYELCTYNVQSDSIPTYDVSERITGKMRWTRKPAENWLVPGIFKVALEKLSELDAKVIAKDVLEQISRDRPDLLFIVLQGQTMFRIGIELHKKGVIFSTFNWDPLSWWLHQNKAPERNIRLVNDILPALDSGGTHILPSPSFSHYLQLKSQKQIVLNLSHDKLENLHEDNRNLLSVCFSGQSYATKEIEFFVKTLDEVDWQIEDFKVELHVFGNTRLGQSSSIIHHGWIEPDELVQRLSVFDCALLPYPSQHHLVEVTKYSFPSKFSTYIAASLPVLFIGPETNPFSEKQREPIYFSKVNDVEGLILGLKNLKNKREEYTRNIPELFESEFSSSAQKAAVAKYLDFQPIPHSADMTSLVQLFKRGSREGQLFRYSEKSIRLANFFSYLHRVLFWLPNIRTSMSSIGLRNILRRHNLMVAGFWAFIQYIVSRLLSRFIH
jgi:hypothetical protein